jgi:hypothetical protein
MEIAARPPATRLPSMRKPHRVILVQRFYANPDGPQICLSETTPRTFAD